MADSTPNADNAAESADTAAPPPAPPSVVIEPPTGAAEALSDDQRAAAQAEAEAAAAKAQDDPNTRFLLYTVPGQAFGRAKTRPSGFNDDDSTLANRIGYAVAQAEVTDKQWVALGISGQKTLVFNRSNNWRVPASDVTEAALNYLLNEDVRYNGRRFALVDGRGNKV
jgi:hypothetical protein